MSWLDKILPPKIKSKDTSSRSSVPAGLWVKCPSCAAVLYATDLQQNMQVCPKCGHHHAIGARERLNIMLDEEGRQEIGATVKPVDILKFKDSKKYPDKLVAARKATGEDDDFTFQAHAFAIQNVEFGLFEWWHHKRQNKPTEQDILWTILNNC